MVSQFEHLKLPRIINIELPRRSGRGFGGGKRADYIEHGKSLLNQLSGLSESTKHKSNPFRLDVIKLRWVERSAAIVHNISYVYYLEIKFKDN